MRYGLQGYGLYFYCLERITDSISETNLTFELEDDSEIIAHDLRLHVDDVQNMMNYMVELGLFENSNGMITCYKLAKRLDSSMTSNPRTRKLIQSVKDSTNSHDAVMTQSALSHDTVMQEEKRREQKRTEQKRKERSAFKKPTLDDVRQYCVERGNKINPESFIDFYDSNGWKVGKNTMKDWKACVRTWEQRDETNKRNSKGGNIYEEGLERLKRFANAG